MSLRQISRVYLSSYSNCRNIGGEKRRAYNVNVISNIATHRLYSNAPNEAEVIREENISTRQDQVVTSSGRPHDSKGTSHYRLLYPEFLPDPDPRYRNALREKLERKDMMNRRKHINIPEFYVGSIVAVTTSDMHALGKTTRFLGLCIERRGPGLRAEFVLRNVLDNQGIEIMYDLYGPTLQKIEVLRLEKRLDSTLYYLRDCPLEYSTFPMDMAPEFRAEGAPIPINTTKIKMNPWPWTRRWEIKELKGIELGDNVPAARMKRIEKALKPWEKYDLMDQYRKTIPEEDQREIFSEIQTELQQLEIHQHKLKRKKVFVKPQRKQ